MVDRYWKKIESVTDDIENSLKISGMLLKIKENVNNISSNLIELNNVKNNMNITSVGAI